MLEIFRELEILADDIERDFPSSSLIRIRIEQERKEEKYRRETRAIMIFESSIA
jgi:hypothetical protein